MREPGTTCRLRVEWWEGPLPEAGDFLRTDAGSCYRIDRWQPARPGSRSLGTFHCTRLDRDAVQLSEPGVWGWAFARRERGRPRYAPA